MHIWGLVRYTELFRPTWTRPTLLATTAAEAIHWIISPLHDLISNKE